MECRKGRRKGSPFLGGLLLAWLLSNGCAVVARNIGECRKLFTISRPARLPDTRERMQRAPLSAFPILAPIKEPVTTRADIYARHIRHGRDSPQAAASFAARRLPRVPFNPRHGEHLLNRRAGQQRSAAGSARRNSRGMPPDQLFFVPFSGRHVASDRD